MATNAQATTRTKSRGRVRELAHRANGDIEVSLLWRKHDNRLTLQLVERATGVEFELAVPPEHALDAFHHPYTYLPTYTLDPLEELLAA